jgi:hypothetical protein
MPFASWMWRRSTSIPAPSTSYPPTRSSHYTIRVHSPLAAACRNTRLVAVRRPPQLFAGSRRACRIYSLAGKPAQQNFGGRSPLPFPPLPLCMTAAGQAEFFFLQHHAVSCPQPRNATRPVRSDKPRAIEPFQRGTAGAASIV